MGISDQFKIPVKYIGIGEKLEDLQVFNKNEFVERRPLVRWLVRQSVFAEAESLSGSGCPLSLQALGTKPKFFTIDQL